MLIYNSKKRIILNKEKQKLLNINDHYLITENYSESVILLDFVRERKTGCDQGHIDTKNNN